ncbi:MAG: phospholipid carrier-dependent glycosyltransferase [Cyanobacteria bacterium P01_D01_bin.123]
MVSWVTSRSHSSVQFEPRDRGLLIGGALIFAIALGLRLWGLGQIDPPVFDEVYFPKFAENYLDGERFFDGHPPLGKYLIALGILLFGRNAIGFRITTALFGAIVPILVMGLLYRLTYRRNLALLGGLLMLSDGLFLVESRFGLMNVFLVAFGLLAQIFLLAGLERRGWGRTLLLSCSGAMLGASAAVKWNGLGFALGLGLIGTMVWAIALLRPKLLPRLGILARIVQLRWWHYLVCFGLMPIAMYVVQWLPHLWMYPRGVTELPAGSDALPALWHTFQDLHRDLLGNHTNANVGVGTDEVVHPYCSTWLSWPVLGRPISYHFNAEGELWSSVLAIGNPILWWTALPAVVGLAIASCFRFRALPAYVLLGYAANYLPWMKVSRCLFLYHYMSALAFSVMALAVVLDGMLNHPRKSLRLTALLVIGAIVMSQVFFMPLWLGLPVTSEQFYTRMWFRPGHWTGFNWV